MKDIKILKNLCIKFRKNLHIEKLK